MYCRSPANHALYPAASRAWAVEMARVARRLRARFPGEEQAFQLMMNSPWPMSSRSIAYSLPTQPQAFSDCWIGHVLRLAVSRA